MAGYVGGISGVVLGLNWRTLSLFRQQHGERLLAVRAEPERLMTLLRAFLHHHTLLNALSDEVIVAWTSLWRRVSILQSVQQYSDRLTDRATQNWIDR